MSIQDKLAQVRAFLEQYNQEVEQSDQVVIDDFFKKLKKAGGTTEELLSELKWEEIEKMGIPLLLAKKLAAIFRVPPKEDPNFVSAKKAANMATLYLLQQYSPDEPTSPVAKELATRAQGKRFIVLDGGAVNVAKSNELFNELQKRFPEREYIDVDGRTLRVYAVGEGKQQLADESPIYAGRPLRPDGTDDQLGRSWNGVSTVIRQLVYVAINSTKELRASHQDAHDILDIALATDGEKKLRQRCRKASVMLDEMTEQGNAPKLKVSLSGVATRQDPFSIPNKTY